MEMERNRGYLTDMMKLSVLPPSWHHVKAGFPPTNCQPSNGLCHFHFLFCSLERGAQTKGPNFSLSVLSRAEMLSTLVGKAEFNHQLMGMVVSRGSPSVTHLFSASDSILFARASPEEAVAIQKQLNKMASGQER